MQLLSFERTRFVESVVVSMKFSLWIHENKRAHYDVRVKDIIFLR